MGTLLAAFVVAASTLVTSTLAFGPDLTAASAATSTTWSPTGCGTISTTTVPSNDNIMKVTVAGAPGASSVGIWGGGGQKGGQGGVVTATYNVYGGQTLSGITACVPPAANGGTTVQADFGSGGWSPGGTGTTGGGGGGGSSALCFNTGDCFSPTYSGLLVVAGGGGWAGGSGGSGGVTSADYMSGSGPSGANGRAASSPWGFGGVNSAFEPFLNAGGGGDQSTTNNTDPDLGGGGGGLIGGQLGNDWAGRWCGSQGGGGGGSSWANSLTEVGTPSFSTSSTPQVQVVFSDTTPPATTPSNSLISTTTTAFATPLAAPFGTPVTFHASVSGVGGSTTHPTGTVTFSFNGSVLCSAQIAGTSGLASCVTSTVPIGDDVVIASNSGDAADVVIASYSGDAVYAPSAGPFVVNILANPPGPPSSVVATVPGPGLVTVTVGASAVINPPVLTYVASVGNQSCLIVVPAKSCTIVTPQSESVIGTTYDDLAFEGSGQPLPSSAIAINSVGDGPPTIGNQVVPTTSLPADVTFGQFNGGLEFDGPHSRLVYYGSGNAYYRAVVSGDPTVPGEGLAPGETLGNLADPWYLCTSQWLGFSQEPNQPANGNNCYVNDN